MTQTIEQLQAKVAELTAEVERLSVAHVKACQANADSQAELVAAQAECEFQRNAHKQAEELMLEQSKQLAAEQLNNKRLREALEAVIKVHGYESGIPVEAISTQASTKELDAYVKQKIKEYY